MTHREVHDPDLELGAIHDRVLDRGDQVARVALALRVEDFVPDERGLRRGALIVALRQVAAARDEAGNVGTMAVIVEGRDGAAAAGEVIEGGNP